MYLKLINIDGWSEGYFLNPLWAVHVYTHMHVPLLGGSVVKNPYSNAGATGDVGLIPGLGRSLEGGTGNPLQYSCLRNPMDRGA